jgi:hypothetical protein
MTDERLLPPTCRSARTVRPGRIEYVAPCGECGDCRRWALKHEPVAQLTDVQRAVFYALDSLGGQGDMASIARKAPDYLDRDACRGGWHDSVNRVPWRLLELGLVTRAVLVRSTVWRVTGAGRLALKVDGHEPRRPASEQAALFGG